MNVTIERIHNCSIDHNDDVLTLYSHPNHYDSYPYITMFERIVENKWGIRIHMDDYTYHHPTTELFKTELDYIGNIIKNGQIDRINERNDIPCRIKSVEKFNICCLYKKYTR